MISRTALPLVLCAAAAAAQGPTASLSLCFDGVDDHVRVPHAPDLPTETFTVAAWVRADLPAGPWSVLVSRGDDDVTDNLPWDLRVDASGELLLVIENALDVAEAYGSGVVVADLEWHHVAATRNGVGEVALFVDGSLTAFFGSSFTPSPNNAQYLTFGCVIGSLGGPPQEPILHLRGGLDEVALWDRALSKTEVAELHAVGVPVASPGLWGHWSFDALSGQTVLDESPAGHHGFLGEAAIADAADPVLVKPWAAAETVRLGLPPNPNALLPGATSGPVAGRTWDPGIDQAVVGAAAVVDFLAISALPANVPTPHGTLLCDISTSPVITPAVPGTRFAVAVPLDCALLGKTLCAQGAAVEPLGTIVLTNALDIRIGHFE